MDIVVFFSDATLILGRSEHSKQLKNKRRKMSIIIRENKFKTLEVFLLNHEKQIYVDPMEDLDQEEMMAVLTDMINSDPI